MSHNLGMTEPDSLTPDLWLITKIYGQPTKHNGNLFIDQRCSKSSLKNESYTEITFTVPQNFFINLPKTGNY